MYENSLLVLLEENGISARSQCPIQVHFHGKIVGYYVADILVENSIILELKAIEKLIPLHKAQALNYLKATQFRLALLINFGKTSLEHDRIVL